MNVLFISSDNAKTSGAFLCMAELCRQLQDKYAVNVKVVLPYDGDGQAILNSLGINSVIIKSCTWAVPIEWNTFEKIKYKFKMCIYNIPAIHKIRKLIRNDKIDIVHINTSWTYAGAIAAKLEGKKLVWHIRELLQQQQQRQIAFQYMGYSLMRKSDILIPVSSFVQDAYRKEFGERLHVVYDGVEEERFYEKKTILKGEKIHLLSIGLLNEQKGQLQAVKAIKILYENGYNNIELKIVGRGDGNYKNLIEDYVCKNGLEKIVHFCGSSSTPEEYYREADIFLMTSRAEAFGRTTVEAMLSGCLVIGAESGATTYLIQNKDTGLIYPLGDSEALAENIITSINNIKRSQEIAMCGQQYAKENFTCKMNAKNIYYLYINLMSS